VLNRRDPRVKLEPGAPFHELVRLGFAHRRKMLRRQIEKCGDAEAAFAKLGISTNARAEELSLDQWIALANALRL
jgi:16S rRNA (adenine1518-N6/adenine1519-N6)-dimethyltransferase